MPSKQVSDRDKAARAVAAAAETHASEIADAVRATAFGGITKGEKLPDVALLVRLAGRLIATRASELVAADAAHETELGDDAAPRAARDAAAEKVRGTLVDLRAALEAAYGAEGLARVGLSGAVATDPSVLALLGERVVAALHASKKLPKARPGLSVDLATFAGELEGAGEKLAAAMKDVAREAREAHATLTAKQRAMAAYDADFARGAAVIEALAALGGLTELAATVRPSGRRPGRTATEDAPPAEPTPTDA